MRFAWSTKRRSDNFDVTKLFAKLVPESQLAFAKMGDDLPCDINNVSVLADRHRFRVTRARCKSCPYADNVILCEDLHASFQDRLCVACRLAFNKQGEPSSFRVRA
jgi:hypothetical protein